MRLDKATYTVFDFETTGLYPYSGDRICEIGALRAYFNRRKRLKFHSLIDPCRPISRGASLVNGITDEMVKGKPTIDKKLPALMKFMKGTVLVAYNAGFDLGFLEAALGPDEAARLADYYIIDALTLARRLFRGLGRYNLGSVASSLGVDTEGEHRAIADATMTWRIFEKEVELLMREGALRVEDIARPHRPRPAAARLVKDYKLKLIEEAIREQKKLNIVYRSVWYDTVTERTITPKEIRRGYDRAYVIAHCHLKDEERNFRLDGIIEASPHA